MSLADHLRSLNAKTEAWIAEDPDNRWAGLYTEDLAHWAEMGVLTVRDFKRHEMESTIWDLYKDVTGCRPRHMDFSKMTYEELEKECDYLWSQMDAQIEADAEWERREEEFRLEQDAERAAWLAEQPEKIDYVACRYQEGWL